MSARPDGTYLDYNATAPVRPEAAEAVWGALTGLGNPSSVHRFGRARRALLEDARDAVGALGGACVDGVIFTSGGTEANALALTGWRRRRVIVSAVEHPSVARAVEGAEILPVDADGVVDLAALETMLESSAGSALVAVMLANHETGVIQPVAEVARLAHAWGALVHVDAIQAAGRIPVGIGALGADSMAVSAHKIGGPQGAGALLLADGAADLEPLLRGGGQELRRRAGTPNLPGLAGFGAAARSAARDLAAEAARLVALRDRLEDEACRLVPDLVVVGRRVARLPNTSCLAWPGRAAQTLVMALDLAGVAVSAGAACSSGTVERSPVLTAMGAGWLAGSAIRVSLGWDSHEDDVDRFLHELGCLKGRANAA